MFGKIYEFINGLIQYNGTDPSKIRPVINIPKSTPVFDMPQESHDWKGIVVHMSDTKDDPIRDDFSIIKNYHMSYRIDGNIVTMEEFNRRKAIGQGVKFEVPWQNIAYNVLLEREGNALKVKIGRPWTMTGAHAGLATTNEFNKEYLGLCVVGDFDQVPPDDEIFFLCVNVIKEIMARFGFDKSQVIGHREVYVRAGVPVEKTCPGAMFSLEYLRSQL